MNRNTAKKGINQWLPIGIGAGFLALSLALIAYTAYAEFLLILLAMPLACITLVVLALVASAHKNRRLMASTGAALVLVFVTSFVVWKHREPIREVLRWSIWSVHFKAELRASPSPKRGELKHIEWEATGFAGVANVTNYLVFDPTDALASAALSGSPGKFSGLPCEVFRVRRLEKFWYSVRFYTDEFWGEGNCSGIL